MSGELTAMEQNPGDEDNGSELLVSILSDILSINGTLKFRGFSTKRGDCRLLDFPSIRTRPFLKVTFPVPTVYIYTIN